MQKPLVLLVLDGWGVHPGAAYNAIEQAKTPQWNKWWQTMPHGLLEASGEAVGLPPGQMGNSEVGHMHIGLGRVIPQDFTRINQAIASGSWEQNPILLNLIHHAKSKGTMHVMGLLSAGGVHSHESHLFAFLSLCEKIGLKNVQLHLFLDGRDVPPQSALISLAKLEKLLQTMPVARIASICGRYFAMDRDKRWERVRVAYQLLTEGKGEKCFPDAVSAVEAYYAAGQTDEFIPPTCIGHPHPMQTGDSCFFFNFRADRARQLVNALVEPHFSGFKREHTMRFDEFVTLTQVEENLKVSVAFPPVLLAATFGEVISAHGLSQLRIAETEKYAHVTFFFDGGVEQIYPYEERILIPSPKVATYDLQPEMSANEITDKLLEVIHARTYDVIICNYANADMVGHTGNIEAAIEAIHCLDRCMQRVGVAVTEAGGGLLITADHGNAELMFDEATGQPHTAHTAYPVPFLFVGQGWCYDAEHGTLADIAPTMLALLGLPQPKEMTGRSLLKRSSK